MKTAFSAVSLNFLSKAGLNSIRSGDVLSVKIIDNKNGLVKVSLGGKMISLKGGDDLLPGSTVRVKALRQGKTLYLNRLSDKPPGPIVTAGGEPLQLNAAVLRAVRRAGLSLKGGQLDILKRLLRKKPGLNRQEARTAAECIRKGISPEDMLPVLGGGSVGDRNSAGDKALVFNQLTEGDDHWFIVPYRFNSGGSGMNGTLRFRRNIKTGRITAEVIETETDRLKLYFLIENPGSENARVRIYSEGKLDQKIKRKIKSTLPEILGNTSFKIDDNIIENCFANEESGFDGFSAEEDSVSSIEEMA